MKRTVTILAALAAALPLLSPAAGADDHVQVRIHCSGKSDKCPAPPQPPAPPAPPPAPAPAPRAWLAPPAPPAPPAVPAVPPMPPAPRIPDIPAAAHAACGTKSAGSTVVWQLGEGETMRGVCARKAGRMVFRLRSYELDA